MGQAVLLRVDAEACLPQLTEAAIYRADPDVSFQILVQRHNGVTRQAVAHRVLSEGSVPEQEQSTTGCSDPEMVLPVFVQGRYRGTGQGLNGPAIGDAAAL